MTASPEAALAALSAVYAEGEAEAVAWPAVESANADETTAKLVAEYVS